MHNRFQTGLRAAAAIAALAAMVLGACTTDPEEEGSKDGVRLKGRVVSLGGTPIAGVVVSSARTGLIDTTDALGRYVLSAREADTTVQSTVLDTLRFQKFGQPLAKITVTSWVEDFPDVQLIQRNISGSLHLGAVLLGRVEFVLTGDGIDTAAPVVTPVYYNALASNYSGFAYFPPTTSVANYEVYVNVYGPGDVLVARSLTVPFNSFAGDITVPAFSPTNAFPVVSAGGNRTVGVGAQVALAGTASDPFGGSIVKWEWSINGGPFVQTSSGDTVITVPSTQQSAYPCVLRVTDDDGNVATSTAVLKVTNDSPVITGLVDTLVVAPGAMVNFSVAATDSHGVARYLWDFDGNGTTDDTTANGSHSLTLPATSGMTTVIVTAEDPFDGRRSDTARIYRLSLGRAWTDRSVGDSELFQDIAWTGSGFMATAVSGAVLTSSNGSSWSPADPVPGRQIVAIASSGSRLVALSRYVGIYDSSIHISTDNGATWSSVMDTVLRARNPQWVEHIGGRFIASMGPGPTLHTSEDGVTWARALVSSAASDGRPLLAWDGNQYLAMVHGNLLMTSSDGVNWSTHYASGLPASSSTYTGLAWADDRYITLAGGQTYHSADGISWTAVGPRRSPTFYKMVWVDGLLLGLGVDGTISISVDKGENWLVRKYSNSFLRNIAWNGSRFVVVGTNGAILTSD